AIAEVVPTSSSNAPSTRSMVGDPLVDSAQPSRSSGRAIGAATPLHSVELPKPHQNDSPSSLGSISPSVALDHPPSPSRTMLPSSSVVLAVLNCVTSQARPNVGTTRPEPARHRLPESGPMNVGV